MAKREISVGLLKGNKPVTVEIELKEKDNKLCLSITGCIINPRRDDFETCGQIQDTIREAMRMNKFKQLDIKHADLKELLRIWDQWHLNDLTAECEHQTPLKEYLKRHGQSTKYQDLTKIAEFNKCPICSYHYGSAWNTRKIPDEVLERIYYFLGGNIYIDGSSD